MRKLIFLLFLAFYSPLLAIDVPITCNISGAKIERYRPKEMDWFSIGNSPIILKDLSENAYVKFRVSAPDYAPQIGEINAQPGMGVKVTLASLKAIEASKARKKTETEAEQIKKEKWEKEHPEEVAKLKQEEEKKQEEIVQHNARLRRERQEYLKAHPQWEYETRFFPDGYTDELANKWGELGFEMVTQRRCKSGECWGMEVVFKRLKTE